MTEISSKIVALILSNHDPSPEMGSFLTSVHHNFLQTMSNFYHGTPRPFHDAIPWFNLSELVCIFKMFENRHGAIHVRDIDCVWFSRESYV